jgi:class 3 adenylate cyclase
MQLSLRQRIVLTVGLPITGIFVVVFGFTLHRMVGQATIGVERKAAELARHFADLLDANLREVAQIADFAAAVIEGEDHPTEEQLYRQLRVNLDQNPLIFGSAVAFEPYRFVRSRRLFSPYVYRQAGEYRQMDIATDAYDYTDPQWEWWHAPRKAEMGVWTEPYFDEGAGNALMSTYATPLFRDGTFWGVVTVDVSLERLEATVRRKITEDQDYVLLTSDGKYIHHPDASKILQSSIFEESTLLDREEIAQVGHLITSGQSGLARVTDWGTEGVQWVIHAPLESTGWGFAALVSERRALDEVSAQVRALLLIGGVGLVCVIFGIWILSDLLAQSIMTSRQEEAQRALGFARVILPIAFMGVLLGGVGWWTHRTIEHTKQDELAQLLRITLSSEAAALRIWLTERREAAVAVASDRALQSRVRQLVDSGLGHAVPAVPDPELRQIVNRLCRSQGFVEGIVTTPTGTIVFSEAADNIGADVAGELAAAAAVIGRTGVITPPFKPALVLIGADGRLARELPSMFAGAPLLDRDGRPFALLFLRLRPEHGFSGILGIARIGESGETYAFNADGMMASESRFSVQLRQLGLLPNRPDSTSLLSVTIRAPAGNMVEGYRPPVPHRELPLTRMAASAVVQHDGLDVHGYRDYRGVPVIGAWEWMEDFGLGIATEIDVTEAYRSLTILRRAFLMIFGLLVLAGVMLLLAYFAIRRAYASLEVEMERSESLLLNVLPKPIAERLKDEKGVIADGFQEVTVLFADIVGFTALSSTIAPRELVNILNSIFFEFDELAERYGLEKIKTIGDAYMVAGGLPAPRPDHAEAVADMALAMVECVKRVGARYPFTLDIRVGIHSGPAVAGVIGAKKFSYDVWGDTVNTASRMESHGETGRIQVSRTTADHLREGYELERRGVIPIKGKGEMETFYLLGEKSAPQDDRAADDGLPVAN